MASEQDIERLVHAVERLQDALAKRILADWNESRATPSEWPCGQGWDDLVTSSHAIFRQAARKEAGLDNTPAFREWLNGFGVEFYADA